MTTQTIEKRLKLLEQKQPESNKWPKICYLHKWDSVEHYMEANGLTEADRGRIHVVQFISAKDVKK